MILLLQTARSSKNTVLRPDKTGSTGYPALSTVDCIPVLYLAFQYWARW